MSPPAHDPDTLSIPAFIDTGDNPGALTAWLQHHPDAFVAGWVERGARPSRRAPDAALEKASTPRIDPLTGRPSEAPERPSETGRDTLGLFRDGPRLALPGGGRGSAAPRSAAPRASAPAPFLPQPAPGLATRPVAPPDAARPPAATGANPTPAPQPASGAAQPTRPSGPAAAGSAPSPAPAAASSKPPAQTPYPLSDHPEPDPASPRQRRRLRANMERDGQMRPRDGQHAHHIVPAGRPMSGTRDARESQERLRRAGIPIDGVENGVPLAPGYHARIHTSEYFRETNLGIARARNPDEMRQFLQAQRERLLQGNREYIQQHPNGE